MIGGCEGRVEPVRIVFPPSTVAVAGPVDAGALRMPHRTAACPPGHVPVGKGCVTAETAFAPRGRTFVVDAARGDDTRDGSSARPWRTVSRATGTGVLQPGDAVLIRAGTYREAVRPRVGGTSADARVTFAAYPGERVVISGADPADTGWTPAGGAAPRGAWRRAYTGDANPYSDDWHFRRPLVISAGRVLTPVETPADLTPGTFTVEGPAERPVALVARFAGDASPQAARPVEVAVRAVGFSPEGPDPYADCGGAATPGWIRLVGVTVRHTTNRAQWGAVCAGSTGGLVEDVAAEWTVGAGVDGSGRGHVFRRVRADRNGQIGWVASCADCLFEDTQAVGNNWKGHDPFWEAGGGKWSRTTGTTIRRHLAEGNEGPGIWFDIDNADNTVEGGRVVGNVGAGVLLELRTVRTLVQHTHIEGTRWRGWTGAGILTQAASSNVIVHNTVVGNAGTGVWLRLDPDRRAPDGGGVVAANWIVGNAARASAEAREVQVEAGSAAGLRSTVFAGNVYGRVAGDTVLRSTFFASPVGRGDVRTNALAAWQAAVGGDADGDLGASLAAGLPDGRLAGALPRGARFAGASWAPLEPRAAAGAHPGLVRTAPR